jgi:ADP-dependent NAD(P)H-hydrate dehydratase / NAD(P)H-hydrate epimerase
VSAPDWLEPLFDADGMRAIDSWAIGARGVPSLELMERAGTAVADEAARMAPDGPLAVLAGKGNNGGDGLVAARILRERGREVTVLLAGAGAELAGDALRNLERLPGAPPATLAAGIAPGCALAIDALLGTGATGEPRGAIAAAIALLDACGAPILAVDGPSGVDASTGEVAGRAISAQATVTFHAAKPGLWIEPGRGHAGHVLVTDIGIPSGAPVPFAAGLVDDAVLATIPRRTGASNKFTSGRVLVAGGSAGLTGAPCLAALAAARAGAGYVTVCAPASLATVVEAKLLEVMTLAIPDEGGAHGPAGVEALAAAAGARGGALVLGPGLGRSPSATAFARAVCAAIELPIVLDADGLNAFAGDPEALAGRVAVITPHEGELGRLLGRPAAEIAARRLRSAREAATRSGAVVVLKGDDTIVVAPDGFAAVSAGATPGLATAGTGDVLSGVLGALLAKGLEPLHAACAGVRLHALAGLAAAARRGPEGLIASDVIDALAAVRR